MKLIKPLLLAAGLGMATAPAMAQQSTPFADLFQSLQRFSAQYAVLIARTFVDLTYESLSVEPGTGNLILSDVVLYPELPWDRDQQCEVTLDRAIVGSVGGFETVSSTIEISGLTLPAACLSPDVGGMLPMFGYQNGIVAGSAIIDISYDLPSSAADLTIQAAVEDAVDLQVTAGFSYLWFRVPLDGPGDDPEPVAYLDALEVALENRGLYERVEPMIAQQVGDPAQLPQMIQGMLGQMLGGTPEGAAFVENLAAEVGRFVAEKNRIVVTAAPEGGVFLGPDTFNSPDDIIAVLQPVVSGAPAAYSAIIAPEVLMAAMQGGQVSDEDRLAVGSALVTGVGAPRSVEQGIELLAPLAEAWNAGAAVLIADAEAQLGNASSAYEAALVAMAGGESRGIGIGDSLEGSMSISEILEAQDRVGNGWPDAAGFEGAMEAMVSEGNVAALRNMAHAASVGRDMPRHYQAAYFFATLAAAAGDRGAASLRARLDRRFGTDPAWRTAAADAAARALDVWTGGMAATIAARAQ